MKKYIRTMLDDLQNKQPPPVLPIPTAVPPTVPEDLTNQELSSDPLQRTRQLDYQAQKDEERETL